MLPSEEIWNPFRGCHKEFRGCERCWMFFLARQRGIDPEEISKNKTNVRVPLDKRRDGTYKIASNTILNVCLTGDFFLEDVPDEWREEVWDIVRRRTDVGFVFLTKRAKRIKECLPCDWGEGYDNVCLAVTVEDQAAADSRIPYLLDVPAKMRRLMCEPLLGPLSLEKYLATGKIDQVLCGGENYDGARICELSWVESLSRQCRKTDVPFTFFDVGSAFSDGHKQYGSRDQWTRREHAKALALDVESDSKRAFALSINPIDDPFAGDALFD